MAGRGVVRAGIGYTVANILVKGIGFLTLPVFSRVLSPCDFGVYNVFIAYDAILFVVMSFALHSSLKSANWEFPGRIDEYTSSLSVIYVFNMAALFVLALLFGPQISELLGLDAVIVVCLVIHSAGEALVTLYNGRVSLQYSYGKYMAVTAASSLGNVGLSFALVFTVFHGQRYLGRIVGATVAFAVTGIFVLILLWCRARPRVDLGWWRFGMSYSLPIVFHGLSQVALSQVGRLMVNYMVSTTAAGIYGLMANLQMILATLTDSVGTVWFTWFYETMEGEPADQATAPKELSREEAEARCGAVQLRSGQLARFFAVITAGLLSVAPEMVWVLGGDAYMGGVRCAFGMSLSGFCVFVYNLVVVGEYYKQKTHYIMWATIAAAIVNVVLNFAVIPAFGYTAAAYATLVSYVLYVAFHWMVSSKLMGFSIICPRSMAATAVILVASAGASAALMDSLVARVAVNAVFCVFLAVPLAKQLGGISGIRSLMGR